MASPYQYYQPKQSSSKLIPMLVVAALLIGLYIYYTYYMNPSPIYVPSQPLPTQPTPKAEPRIYFGAASCPAGWRDLGQYGLIVNKWYQPYSPLAKGGDESPDWAWNHGRLCGGDSSMDKSNLYALTGNDQGTLTGLLLHNSAYDKNPALWGKGGAYNESWTWTHPRLLPAGTANSYRPSTTGDIGPIGFIMEKANVASSGLPTGGDLNPSWTWVHPNMVLDT